MGQLCQTWVSPNEPWFGQRKFHRDISLDVSYVDADETETGIAHLAIRDEFSEITENLRSLR